MSQKYALVEYSSAINTIIHKTFHSTQRIKFTAFDVSHKYIVFGANSGGIYIFTREPCQFLKLIPSTHGATNLLQISPNEDNLAIAVLTGIVIILEGCFTPNFEQQVFMQHEGTIVTAMKWNGHDLYCGDKIGRVSVITLQNFLSKAIFQTPSACLMQLDSQIVQLDTYSKYLLVSTQTRSLLCDTESERYRQIGKKMRDGTFGACFFGSEKMKEVSDISTRIKGVFQTLNENEELSSSSSNDSNVKIYCARPGIRLWQSDFQGNVILTHQFRPTLPKEQSNIISWDEADELKIKIFLDADLGENFNFGKIFSFLDMFILTFRTEGFYIFEPSSSALLYWSAHINNIKDIKIVDSYLYIWHGDLDVNVMSLLTIEELILRSLMRKKYTLCGELCVEFLEEVERLLETSKKIHLISILETKLDNHDILEKLRHIFQKLKDCARTPSLEKFRNGIVTVNALPVLPESVQNFECEKETKKPLNILTEQYKINKLHKNIETTDFIHLVQSLKPQHFYELIIDFHKETNESASWCKEIFLKYLNLTEDLNSDALNYACRAFCEVNHCENLICKCGFPLPEAHINIPKFYEIGCKLMEKSDNYSQFLGNVPFMNKYILERIQPKDLQLKISLIIQFSDPKIIEMYLNQITYDIWDESIRLLHKLKVGNCLNCGTKIDPGGSFTWTNFGVFMTQSIKPTNTIKLLKRHANLLPKGELNYFFYQYCIFSAATNLSSTVLRSTLQDEQVGKQFEMSVGGYLSKKYSRSADNNPLTTHKSSELNNNCDHCHMPLKIPVIEDVKKLECGHSYHLVCFLHINSQCSICDVYRISDK